MDKKVTRKQFLLSALSITALLFVSKVPSVVKNSFSQTRKWGNTYGNNAYGGGKKKE